MTGAIKSRQLCQHNFSLLHEQPSIISKPTMYFDVVDKTLGIHRWSLVCCIYCVIHGIFNIIKDLPLLVTTEATSSNVTYKRN